MPAQHERQRGPASVPGIARTFTPLYRADTDCAAVAQCLGCNSMIYDQDPGDTGERPQTPAHRRLSRGQSDSCNSELEVSRLYSRASTEGSCHEPRVEDFTITEKVPTRAFSLLKASASAYKFNTLLMYKTIC